MCSKIRGVNRQSGQPRRRSGRGGMVVTGRNRIARGRYRGVPHGRKNKRRSGSRVKSVGIVVAIVLLQAPWWNGRILWVRGRMAGGGCHQPLNRHHKAKHHYPPRQAARSKPDRRPRSSHAAEHLLRVIFECRGALRAGCVIDLPPRPAPGHPVHVHCLRTLPPEYSQVHEHRPHQTALPAWADFSCCPIGRTV